MYRIKLNIWTLDGSIYAILISVILSPIDLWNHLTFNKLNANNNIDFRIELFTLEKKNQSINLNDLFSLSK